MIDGREAGPMSRAEFALRLATDVVDEETFVWKEGMREWLPAAQVRDLAPMFQTRKQAKQDGVRPPPPPAAAKAKTKRREEDAGGGLRVEDDEEEVVLELDLDALKHAKPGHPAPTAPPPGSTAPPPARTAPPPARTAPPPARTAPAPAPAQAVRLAPEPPRVEQAPPPEPEEEFAADRTLMEVLPLGERVHQEEVAQDLFAPGDTPPKVGKTGSFAIDSLKWAYAKPKRESKPDAKSAAILKAMQATAVRPAVPSEPAIEVAAPPRQPLPPVNPAVLAGARPLVPRRPSPLLQAAIVFAVFGVGGLIVGFAIFFLLKLFL
jgi:hypothetical protein